MRRLPKAKLFLPSVSSAFTRPGTPPDPNSSDGVIVVKTEYDGAGHAFLTTDNKGIETLRLYDALGRTLTVQENYTGTAPSEGTPSDEENRTTRYTYNADSQVVTQTADMPSGTDDQVTKYVYAKELSDKGSGYEVENGELTSLISRGSTPHVPTLAGTDTLWVKITCDGSTVSVKEATSEAGLSGATACYTSSSNTFDHSGGMMGLCPESAEALIDDLTIKADRNADGDFTDTGETEHYDGFNADSGFTHSDDDELTT